MAPLVVRRAQRDVRLGGVAVPAGTCLLLHVYAMHTTSANWAQPHAFLPVGAPAHSAPYPRADGQAACHSLGLYLINTAPQASTCCSCWQVRVLALGGAGRDGAEGALQTAWASVLTCRLPP